jgi:hypothetical protein
MDIQADQVLKDILVGAHQISDPARRTNFYAAQAEILNASVELDSLPATHTTKVKHQLARQMLEAALEEAKAWNDPAEMASLHRALGITFILLNEKTSARQHLSAALQQHQTLSAVDEEAIDLAYAAFVTPEEFTNRERLQKAWKRVEAQTEIALTAAAKCTRLEAKAKVLCLLANWHIDCLKLESARAYLLEGMGLAKQTGSAEISGLAALYFGIMEAYLKHRLEKSIRWLTQARSDYQKAGNKQDEIECLFHLGSVYWDKGDVRVGLEFWEEALSIHTKRGEPADAWAAARMAEYIQAHREHADQIGSKAGRRTIRQEGDRLSAQVGMRGAESDTRAARPQPIARQSKHPANDQGQLFVLVKKHFQFLEDDFGFRGVLLDEERNECQKDALPGKRGRMEFYRPSIEVNAEDDQRHVSYLQAMAIYKANQPAVVIVWDEGQERMRVLFYADQPVHRQFYDIETIGACKVQMAGEDTLPVDASFDNDVEQAVERSAWLVRKYALPWRPGEMQPLLDAFLRQLDSTWAWQHCNDPRTMLQFLEGKASDRKLRLFVCGYWRLINQNPRPNRFKRPYVPVIPRWSISAEERFIGANKYDSLDIAIEIAEDAAEGLAPAADLAYAEKVLSDIHYSGAGWEYLEPSLSNASTACMASAVMAAQSIDACPVAMTHATGGDFEYECNVLREIFGNPFSDLQPPDPNWLTDEVCNLAQDIYQTYAFEKLPRLADLLYAAGCNRKDVLMHLKANKPMSIDPYYRNNTGSHVRGCWALDWVLGKT